MTSSRPRRPGVGDGRPLLTNESLSGFPGWSRSKVSGACKKQDHRNIMRWKCTIPHGRNVMLRWRATPDKVSPGPQCCTSGRFL